MQLKNKKKKLVHFIHKPFLAGAQRASLDIFKSMDKDDYELFLIYAHDSSFPSELIIPFVKEFELLGVKTIPLYSLKKDIGFSDIFTLFELFKVLKSVKPDIINTISSKPFFLGGVVSFLLRVPMRIHTIQGLSWYDGMSFFQKYFRFGLEQICILFFNKIVFVNNYYMKFFLLNKSKFVYIPNGKKFDDLDPVPKDNNFIKILFIGRLDLQKDPFTLIFAFKNFLNNYKGNKNVFLDIVGDGPYRDSLVQFVKKCPILEQKVSFLGWSNDVNFHLNKADIFISTPIYEAFGFVFLEAGNFYLPIVSTNTEGVPEVVLDKKGGFLSNVKDFVSISKSIEVLVDNPNLRLELGKFHGQFCRKYYSSSLVDKYYNDLYSS